MLLHVRTGKGSATESVMDAGIKSSQDCLSRTFLGLQISTFDWKVALARAEELALSKGEPATLSFLDERKLASALLGLGSRDASKRQLLLPAGGVFLRLLLKFVWRRKQAEEVFSPAGFISALLTYFAEPRRIGLAGEDKVRVEALCLYFGRHTPWHEFVAITPDTHMLGRIDLVIADTADAVAERNMQLRLGDHDIGLVIIAGRGLSRLARPKKTTKSAQPSISKPSFA